MSKIEAIVSPWIFYLIGMMPALNIAIILLDVFCFAYSLFSIICFSLAFMCKDDKDKDAKEREEKEQWSKYFLKKSKKFFAIGVILLFIDVCIPSQNTMYKMLISNYVTPNNLEYIHETIKGDMNDALNAIADNIIKVQKEGK